MAHLMMYPNKRVFATVEKSLPNTYLPDLGFIEPTGTDTISTSLLLGMQTV